MNKIAIILTILIILGAISGGIWFYLNKMQMPEPVEITTPNVNNSQNQNSQQQIKEDSVSAMENDLSEIESTDLDAEFKDIDTDLGSL